MSDYLLDCNHLSAAIRKVSVIRDRVNQARKSGHRFITCFPVLCELEVGIQQTVMPDDYRRRLAVFLQQVRIWPLDSETARFYGTIFHELRQQGRALSQIDLILAAVARQHLLTMLTTDRDFQAVSGIMVEDWVTVS